MRVFTALRLSAIEQLGEANARDAVEADDLDLEQDFIEDPDPFVRLVVDVLRLKIALRQLAPRHPRRTLMTARRVGSIFVEMVANRVLEPQLPDRANRAERRRCARAGHRWKRFGDGTVRCTGCGEVGT